MLEGKDGADGPAAVPADGSRGMAAAVATTAAAMMAYFAVG